MLNFKGREGKKAMEKYYTPEEVAKLLKTSRETVYNWLRSGKLKGVKVFNFWRVPESELNRLLKGEKKET
jgi:excisionase family DNA binding protein